MAVLATAFNACTDEYEYDAVTDTDNSGAYILTDTESPTITVNIPEDDPQQVTFSVARHDFSSAETVKLSVDDSNVTIPSEVNFAAGDSVQQVTATFNIPVGTVGYEFTVSIADEHPYTYGRHSQVFSINRMRRVTGAMMYEGGLLFEGAAWETQIYEAGVTSSGSNFLVVDPLHNTDVENAIGLTESETTGYSFTLTISTADNSATLSRGAALFYLSADMTGDASVTGDATPNVNLGIYSKDNVTLPTGDTLSNCVWFSWNILIGSTGYGYNTSYGAFIFPDGYNPLTQTQATQE